MSTDVSSKKGVPTKLDLLLRMAELQKQQFASLTNAEREKTAGNPAGVRSWYDANINSGKQYIETALLHNKHYEQPVDIAPIVQSLVNVMFMQADTLESIAEYQQASALRVEATELSYKYLGLAGKLDAERSTAISLVREGRFNEALSTLFKLRNQLLVGNEGIPLIRITIDIVDMLQWLGDYRRAFDELERAAGLLKRIVGEHPPDMRSVMNTLLQSAADAMAGRTGAGTKAEDAMALYRATVEFTYYKGLINKFLQKYEVAEANFKEVLPAYQQLQVGPAIEFQLAAIDVGKGDYASGLKRAQALELLFRKPGPMRPKLAALLKVQAEALAKMGRNDEALKKLDEGIQDLSFYEDADLLWRLLWLEGQCLEANNRSHESLESYVRAANVVNGLRRAPLGYRLDSTYLRDKIPLFESAISLASRVGKAEQCCALIEMIKSRILTATLGSRAAAKGTHSQSDALSEKVDGLTRKIEALEYSMWQEGSTAKQKNEREEFLQERATALEEMRISDPRWRNLTEPIRFDVAEIMGLSQRSGTSFLNLFCVPGCIVAVLLREGKASTATLPIGTSVLEIINQYAQNLQAPWPYSDGSLYDPSASSNLCAEQLVPDELLQEAVKSKRLVVAPHGMLHLLPWGGLMYRGKRLFEYVPVGIVPNLSCVSSLSVVSSTSPRVALVGPPDYSNLPGFSNLLGAEKEFREIEAIHRESGHLVGKPLSGQTVTEEAFWELTRLPETEGGILHVACHGIVDVEDPLHSGLVLTRTRIDASEIALSSLRFDEVVLSACSTGWRPVEVKDIALSGDDILGLPGAFLEAGVRSVLVSIPPADDEAACKFMVHYHLQRRAGSAPLVALQETQKEMLKDSSHNPCTWIGFTVYGCR